MGQMVNVCAIGNTSNKRINAVSDNIIIITCNCTTGPRENCAVPNKKLFGPMMYIQTYQNTDAHIHVHVHVLGLENSIQNFVSKNERIFEGLHVFLSMLLLP